MSDLAGNPEDRFSHNEAHLCVMFHVLFTDETCLDPAIESHPVSIGMLQLRRLQIITLFSLAHHLISHPPNLFY